MSDFERPTCHVCNGKIETGESHLGPPFVDKTKHMICPSECAQCGMKFWDMDRHIQVCEGHK